MKTHEEIALEAFHSGYNCAQSVLLAFCRDVGLDDDQALKIACGFGAGIARKQDVCGAVSGAIAAIGLKHGRGRGQDKTATEATYTKVQDLIDRFEAKRGSWQCRALLQGHDLNTPEGRQAIQEKKLIASTCQECVRTAVEAVEAIL